MLQCKQTKKDARKSLRSTFSTFQLTAITGWNCLPFYPV